MNDQKYCPSCGKANPGDAVFCAKCGNQFGTAPVTGIPPAEPPMYYEPIPSSPRKFKKRYILYGVVGLFILFIAVSAAFPSSQSSEAVTSSPTAQASVKETPTSTPTPTVSSIDYSSSIGQYWETTGYTVTTPFIKTMIESREAYQGAVSDGNRSYRITNIITSPPYENTRYQNKLLADYKALGFVTEYTQGSGFKVDAPTLMKENSHVQVGAYSIMYGTNDPGVIIMEWKTSY